MNARITDFSKYTKAADRVDMPSARVGLCGVGREFQYLVYDPSTGDYTLLTFDGDMVSEQEALEEATASINTAFNKAAKKAAAAVSGEPGFEDAELTVTLSDRGMQLAFADPLPGRQAVSLGSSRAKWLHAFVFVFTLGAVRIGTMR